MIQKLSPETLRTQKGISFPGITTAFVCHDGAGKVFMAKRSQNARDEQGKWDFGAGGLKFGCSIEENLRREIKEEYGATALNIHFLGYGDIFRTREDGTPTHWLGLFHAVKVKLNDVHIAEPDMFDDSGWFTLDDLPSPLHSQIEKIYLKKYRKDLDLIINTDI